MTCDCGKSVPFPGYRIYDSHDRFCSPECAQKAEWQLLETACAGPGAGALSLTAPRQARPFWGRLPPFRRA